VNRIANHAKIAAMKALDRGCRHQPVDLAHRPTLLPDGLRAASIARRIAVPFRRTQKAAETAAASPATSTL
jgi:hypothetical protein